MTQIEKAIKGLITEEMKEVALMEGVEPSYIRSRIVDGTVIITRNKKRSIKPLAIGKGLRTKVNANIGTSQDKIDLPFL